MFLYVFERKSHRALKHIIRQYTQRISVLPDDVHAQYILKNKNIFDHDITITYMTITKV